MEGVGLGRASRRDDVSERASKDKFNRQTGESISGRGNSETHLDHTVFTRRGSR